MDTSRGNLMPFSIRCLVTFALIGPVIGLFCRNCDAVQDDDDCQTAHACQAGEICFHDVLINDTGASYTRLGCRSSTACSGALIGRRASANILCSSCCVKDLCKTTACQNIDHCLLNPCVFGTCHNVVNDYTCTCLHGYSGKNCDTHNTDPCASNPCVHGTCASSGGQFNCTCNFGYAGRSCDKIDPCLSNPCVFGTCLTVGELYACVCDRGYSGKNCDVAWPCKSNPCVHGTCFASAGSSSFKCTCAAGYTGDTCNTVVPPRPCASSPCIHGTCVGHGASYTCHCNTGYSGTQCDKLASPCVPNPCVHGACSLHSTSTSGYSCTCNAGYGGTNCDTVDPCASRQCLHGKCTVSSAGAAVCVCDPGYKGSFCDTDIDECASSPCKHGSCMDRVNAYTCTCSLGYTGKNCDTATSTPCSPNPCVHGTCSLRSTSGSGYICTCNMGYAGTNCTTLSHPCASNPCVHGHCIDHGSSYKCHCDVGYYATNCDKKVRDCKDVLDGHLPSATHDQIYTVKIGQSTENVRCDMVTDGGGWTVIMNRETATINFTKDATDYALGFGNTRADFWIGLEDMHKLTSDGRRYQLRVELTRGNGSKYYEVYDDFRIGPHPNFVLYIGAAHGTAGDALRHHDGYGFSTFDRDLDSNKNDNCAIYLQGAWWFHECYDSCLTCPYERPGALNTCRSMSWNTVNYCEALKAARMLVRPL